jgi:2-hydroxychromene-2-carboxylate isomerase
MTAIDFYFDFASPYGFIAAMQIEAVGRPVRWRPFLLGSVYKAVGQSPLEHPLKRAYVIDVDAPRMARRIGLHLKVPAGFPEHSLPPSRAFYWIDQHDPVKAVAFAKAAYRKYWLHGCATSDAAVAVDAAALVGYDPEAVIEGMQRSETKERLIFENEQAIRRGVFGSPFFFADGEQFWGSDRISLMVGDSRAAAEATAVPGRPVM